MPRHKNLNKLIDSSSSSREYFLSLPTEVQLELHRQKERIHTAHELRQNATLLINHIEFLKNTGHGNETWL